MSKHSTRSRVTYLFDGSQTRTGEIRQLGSPYDLRAALTVSPANKSTAAVGKCELALKNERQSIEEMLSWTMENNTGQIAG